MLLKLGTLATSLCILAGTAGCMSLFPKREPAPDSVTDFEGKPLPGSSVQSDPNQLEQLPGSSVQSDPNQLEQLPGSSIDAAVEGPTGMAKYTPSNLWKSTKNAVGLGPDQKLARQSFQEGEEIFRRAQSKDDYADAAKKFNVAANRWPDSGLEEDALFWLGESYFFADKYPKAEDTYDALIKKYANSRYLDEVIVRQFAIAQYWYQYNQANPSFPITPNLVDRTRPYFDTGGHGLATFDRVRLNDPRGPLADDALMATANAYFLKQRYEDADYYYSLVRKDYPKSEHLMQAYVLGLQSKLRSYQGADYDGTPLDGADELIDQMLVQFPNELQDERERLMLTKKELAAQRANRDFELAEYYDKGEKYGAARYYYQNIVKNYPQSSFAEQSRDRLAQISSEPDNPPNRLAWIDSIFDEDQRKDSLRNSKPSTAPAEAPSTMLR